MENTVRIASWIIVTGSLLVLGRNLMITDGSDLALPDMSSSQVSGTLVQQQAPVTPEPAVLVTLDETEPETTAAMIPADADETVTSSSSDSTEHTQDDDLVLNPPG